MGMYARLSDKEKLTRIRKVEALVSRKGISITEALKQLGYPPTVSNFQALKRKMRDAGKINGQGFLRHVDMLEKPKRGKSNGHVFSVPVGNSSEQTVAFHLTAAQVARLLTIVLGLPERKE